MNFAHPHEIEPDAFAHKQFMRELDATDLLVYASGMLYAYSAARNLEHTAQITTFRLEYAALRFEMNLRVAEAANKLR